MEATKKLYKFFNNYVNAPAELIGFDYQYITDVEVEDIDHNDAPDYSDAFISSAKYHGLELNDKLLDKLNEDRDFVYEQAMKHIY